MEKPRPTNRTAPPATPTPMPALSPAVRPVLLLLLLLLLLVVEEAVGIVVVVAEAEVVAEEDEVEEMPRETGMFWAESWKQQAVLLRPQHHFVAVLLAPQGVTCAVPSGEASCCSLWVVSDDAGVGAGVDFFGCCAGVSTVCFWVCIKVLLKGRCITGLEVFMTYPVARANI